MQYMKVQYFVIGIGRVFIILFKRRNSNKKTIRKILHNSLIMLSNHFCPCSDLYNKLLFYVMKLITNKSKCYLIFLYKLYFHSDFNKQY